MSCANESPGAVVDHGASEVPAQYSGCPSKLILSRRSLLTPELAAAWLDEIAEAFGGQPTWSCDGMRRLLSAATDIIVPLALSLAPEGDVDGKTGRIRLFVPRPFETAMNITFDPERGVWETADAIGFGVDGLVGKCQRHHSRHKDLGPLDGATCLAACLSLAVLAVAERRNRAGS